MKTSLKLAVRMVMGMALLLAAAAVSHAQTPVVQHSYAATDLPNDFTATNQFSVGLFTGPLTFSQITALTFVNPGTIITCSNCTASSNPCTIGSSQVIAIYLNGAWNCSGFGGGGGGTNIQVNGGANLGTPVNFQNGTSGNVINFSNPSGTIIQATIQASSVTNAMLAHNSITITTASGSGLSGGGTVALGGAIALTFLPCSTNQIPLYNGTIWTCFTGGTGTVTGGGTTNAIPKWTSGSALGNSAVTDNGTIIASTENIQAPVLVSTVAIGTAPLTVTSTTPVANLSIGGNAATATNASELLTFTWAVPGTIGSTTPSTGAFTTLGVSSTLTLSSITGATQCLQVNSSGVVAGTGSACGSGGGGGNVNGPGSSTSGDIVLFNNTSGTLLSDAGFGFPLANAHLANSTITLNGTANEISSPGSTALGGTATFAITNPFIFPGKATFAASTTSAASFNIPTGSAPTSPASGDYWNLSGIEQFYDGTHTNSFTTIQAAPTSLDLAEFSGTSGLLIDSNVIAANVVTQTTNGAANQVCTYTASNKACVPGQVTNSMLVNDVVTVTAGAGLSGGGAIALGGSTTLTANFAPVITSPVNTQVFVYNGTNWINEYPGINVNAQTGDYTFVCPTDRLGEIEFNISAAQGFYLPQAGSTACTGANMGMAVRNTSTSTAALTVCSGTGTSGSCTAGSSQFLPEARNSVTLPPGAALFIYSDATTSTGNYHDISVSTPYGGIDEQTTSYTLSLLDKDKIVVMNCTAACAATLPNPPPSTKWNAKILSIGSTLATVSLNSLNLNGAATAPTLTTGHTIELATDGSNYFGDISSSGGGSGTFAGLTPGINTSTTPFGVEPATTVGGSTPNFSIITPASDTNTGAALFVSTGASSTQPTVDFQVQGQDAFKIIEITGANQQSLSGLCSTLPNTSTDVARWVQCASSAAITNIRAINFSSAFTGTGIQFETETASGTGFKLFSGRVAVNADGTIGSGTEVFNVLGNGAVNGLSFTANAAGAGYLALTAGSEGCVSNQPSGSVCLEAPASIATSYHMIWPNAVGTASQVLYIASVTGQAITLGWTTPSGGGGTPCTTTANSLQYNNSGAFGCVTDWTASATTLTAAAAGIMDASAATGTAAFKVPVAAGNTATAAGTIDFDSTNNNFHGYVNGADSIFANFASAPTNNVLPKSVIASGNTLLANSLLTDNATTLTYTGTGGLALTGAGATVGIGTPPSCVAGTAAYLCLLEGTAPTGVSGTDLIYANSTNHRMQTINGTVDWGPSAGTLAWLDQTGVSTANSGSAQNILASTPAAGHYRVHLYVDQSAGCTTLGIGALTVIVGWTDATHARVSATQTLTVATADTGTGDWVQIVQDLWSANAAAITTTATYTACTTGTWTYDLHAYVERAE